MTNTQSFAKQELNILAKTVPDAVITPFSKEIFMLCEAFGRSGESGNSAHFVATEISQSIKKLLLQEPICPIMGTDEEWVQVKDISENDDMMYQNKRCSRLFKAKNGKCWYLDAIVKKVARSGYCWSGSFWLTKEDYLKRDESKIIGSSHYVKSFPFTPKTFYIDVVEEKVAKDDWEMYLLDPKQLEKVWKYYDKKD